MLSVLTDLQLLSSCPVQDFNSVLKGVLADVQIAVGGRDLTVTCQTCDLLHGDTASL